MYLQPVRRWPLVVPQPAPLLRAVIALCVGVLSTAACPLPIARTEALSAPVAGVLRQSDGAPISGARLSVSTDIDDSACAHAVLETTTDSAGAFRFPGTEKRYSVQWVVQT